MKLTTKLAVSATLAGMVLPLVGMVMPAFAHHAFAAEYDAKRHVELKGTVTKMEWINPHAWIHIDVKKADGTAEEWMIEFYPEHAAAARIHAGFVEARDGDQRGRVSVQGRIAARQRAGREVTGRAGAVCGITGSGRAIQRRGIEVPTFPLTRGHWFLRVAALLATRGNFFCPLALLFIRHCGCSVVSITGIKAVLARTDALLPKPSQCPGQGRRQSSGAGSASFASPAPLGV